MYRSIQKLYIASIITSFIFIAVPSVYAAYGDFDGPYGHNDGIHGGNRLDPAAFPAVDPLIIGWATGVVDFHRNAGIEHGAPEDVLGQPGGTFDVFALGDGGWITVSFDAPFVNISGPDFAVWENGFISGQAAELGLLFSELMYVEVSTNGVDFVRFPSINGVPQPIGGFGCLDPTYIHNVAGKHPNGNDGRDEGTPFDLEDLSDDPLVLDGTVDLNSISFVRLIDVVGDGSTVDSNGQPMYDPYPTPFGTGGADLDAIGVLGPSAAPAKPILTHPENGADQVELTPQLTTSPFSDPDGDAHQYSQWQISVGSDWGIADDFIADITSETQLTALHVPIDMLAESQTYYWRVRFYDQHNSASHWSETFSFTTHVLLPSEKEDDDGNGVPDSQQNVIIEDLDSTDGDDRLQPDIKTLHTVVGDQDAGLKIPSTVLAIERFRSIDPSILGDLADLPESMPFGVLGFKLKVPVGGTINVDIYLSESLTQDHSWYRYTPQKGWQNYSANTTITPLEDPITRITLLLTDGGPGDADGTANGWILDSGGPVGPSSTPDDPTPDDPTPDDPTPNDPTSEDDAQEPGGGGGGGGGGCFISLM